MIELGHHLVIDLQPSSRVDDDDAVAAALRGLDAGLGDAYDVGGVALGVNGDAELAAERLELIDSGGTIDIGCDEARGLPFRLQLAGELRRGRRFSGTLQAHHHHDSRGHGAELERLAALAEHDGELVVHDLDELLCGRDGAQLCDTDCFFFNSLEELARELEVDVGFKEDAPHLAQCFLDVGFIENAPPAQAREGGFEFLAQLIEHSPET